MLGAGCHFMRCLKIVYPWYIIIIIVIELLVVGCCLFLMSQLSKKGWARRSQHGKSINCTRGTRRFRLNHQLPLIAQRCTEKGGKGSYCAPLTLLVRPFISQNDQLETRSEMATLSGCNYAITLQNSSKVAVVFSRV